MDKAWKLIFYVGLPIVLLSSMGCAKPRTQPPPTFTQILQAEGVTEQQITERVADCAPAPNARKIYQAFVRGRDRVATLYPEAKFLSMNIISFAQTCLSWNEGEEFPRIRGHGAMGFSQGTVIFYAFEEVIEHEVAHVLVFLLDNRERTWEAINAPGDEDQAEYLFLYQIVCHNTTDDPFAGSNISISGRAGCSRPYSSPVD